MIRRGSWVLAWLALGTLWGCASAPRPRADAPASAGHFYTVKEGDTLWRIARAHGVDVETLMRVNNIEDPGALKSATLLYIPGVEGPQDGAQDASLTPAPPPPSRTLEFAWPVDGVVTSRFGPRRGRQHDGIDIAAPGGTPVHSAGAGEVIHAAGNMRDYGNIVIVRHDDDYVTIYAHNARNLVKQGDRVEAGQHIADVGETGNAEGPHVHFEVRRGGLPVDPMPFLPD
jgi:lipoprotein NlpD